MNSDSEVHDWYVTVSDDCQVIKSWIINDLPYHKAFTEAKEQVETHYKFFHWTLNRI